MPGSSISDVVSVIVEIKNKGCIKIRDHFNDFDEPNIFCGSSFCGFERIGLREIRDGCGLLFF